LLRKFRDDRVGGETRTVKKQTIREPANLVIKPLKLFFKMAQERYLRGFACFLRCDPARRNGRSQGAMKTAASHFSARFIP